eukprot:5969286-Pyramimonas_sp.AAC.1
MDGSPSGMPRQSTGRNGNYRAHGSRCVAGGKCSSHQIGTMLHWSTPRPTWSPLLRRHWELPGTKLESAHQTAPGPLAHQRTFEHLTPGHRVNPKY